MGVRVPLLASFTIERERTVDGRSIGLAVVLAFYGACAVAAVVWAALAGRPRLVYDPRLASPSRALLGAGIGLAGGLLTVAASRLLTRVRWGRELFDWFATLLGPLSRREVLLYALCSGLGEELLFRGAIQPSLGLLPTTAVFALLHVPPKLGLWPWTAFAGILGLGLGALARWSGDLGGAILAHVTVNAFNLGAVARRARERVSAGAEQPTTSLQKLPGPDPAPSMGLSPRAESSPSHAPSNDPPDPAVPPDRDPGRGR